MTERKIVVTLTPRVPAARIRLARYLRDLADAIEADIAEYEPNAAMIVLTGRTHHEVLHVGNDAEPGFLGGAVQAALAVHLTPYNTVGGNVRPRTHGYSAGRKDASVITFRRKADGEVQE